MENKKTESDNECNLNQQNIWGAETGIISEQLTYWNFEEFEFEEKASIILQHGAIVSVLRQDEFVVLLCFYNGFYTQLFADTTISHKLVYMEIASTFSLMKHIKKDLEKSNTQFLG